MNRSWLSVAGVFLVALVTTSTQSIAAPQSGAADAQSSPPAGAATNSATPPASASTDTNDASAATPAASPAASPEASPAAATQTNTPKPASKPRHRVHKTSTTSKASTTSTATATSTASAGATASVAQTAPAKSAPPPPHLKINGRIELSAGSGQQVAPGERVDTLVYFVPKSGDAHPKPGHFTIYTDNHDFKPQALAVPLGSTVTFDNLDIVRHSVYSSTQGSEFDLGFQAAGDKIDHVFSKPGFVLISCRVHTTMEQDLLVVPTRYVAAVAADGSFSIGGLAAGPGTLFVWNPRAGLLGQPVILPLADTITEHLVAIKPRMVTELHTEATP